MPRSSAVWLLFLILPAALFAQDSTSSLRRRAGHWHIGLAYHDNGITIGNAARTNGIRINAVDADLELVNGVNMTLWRPSGELSGTVNGLAVGLAPGATISTAPPSGSWRQWPMSARAGLHSAGSPLFRTATSRGSPCRGSAPSRTTISPG